VNKGLWIVLAGLLAVPALAASDLPVVVNGVTGQIQRIPSADSLSVAAGGLGVNNPTVHGILMGEGASPVSSVVGGPTCLWYSASTSVDASCANTIGGLYNFTSISNGVIDIGVTTPTAPLFVSFNANTGSYAPVTTSAFQAIGADGQGVQLELDTFGTIQPTITYNTHAGTFGSPTAIPSGAGMGNFGWRADDGTTHNAVGASFRVLSTQAWTPTAHGSREQYLVVANNSTLSNVIADFDGSIPGVALGGPTGSESFRAPVVVSAVDHVKCSGAATANPATVACVAEGTDTNVNLQLAGLGSGAVTLAESHLGSTQATLPTVATCGTGSPTVTTGSTDTRGSVTTGTAATACTITFKGNAGAGFATAPFCVVSDNSLTINASVTSTSTTTLVLGLSGVGLTSGVVTWHCLQ
jgi:hypothetical protein